MSRFRFCPCWHSGRARYDCSDYEQTGDCSGVVHADKVSFGKLYARYCELIGMKIKLGIIERLHRMTLAMSECLGRRLAD